MTEENKGSRYFTIMERPLGQAWNFTVDQRMIDDFIKRKVAEDSLTAFLLTLFKTIEGKYKESGPTSGS